MSVEITTLANGLTVVTDQMPHVDSVSLGLWVGRGSRCESEAEHGISHLLEHMAFKGTRRRTARGIAEEIEAVGGELDAATSVESTSYYAQVLRGDVPLMIDILGDIIRDSVFDGEELAREKHVILQEIGAARDTPDDYLFDLFPQAAWRSQPIGRPILGTPETVMGFDAGSLRRHLDRHYRGGEMVFSAAGAVNHDEIVALVSAQFSDLPAGTGPGIESAAYSGGQLIEARDLVETQIVLGFPGVGIREHDYFAAQALATLLGGGMSSRLFQEVREQRGLCYSIYAFHWGFSDTGVFGIHAATGPEDVAELMPVVVDELARVVDDVSDEELSRARAQLRAGLLMARERSSARAGQMARHIQTHGRVISPEELVDLIDSVDVQSVRKVAARMLGGQAPTLAAVGDVANVPSVDWISQRMGAYASDAPHRLSRTG
ncbi:M16 family metallopeptidase [Amorphus orientalis]|uniref:Zn-dependent peptidase n=1 Tax=Amorphus orientalis TaxID=649198 RepID=A0AAE3VQ84_9HYPH|nr:pitrilysin family protein [Amorphus orientalis]MDQ0316160.1 putative Zn-dependent peptidase [Amorphus orientalis]